MRARKRARPIVMTTVAMIAGMVPIAIGLGADSDFRSPMAIAVDRRAGDFDAAEPGRDSRSVFTVMDEPAEL